MKIPTNVAKIMPPKTARPVRGTQRGGRIDRSASSATLSLMELRPLGRTGVRVSPLALGCMNFGDPTPEDESIRIIHKALERGVNLLDTADVYGRGGSETVVGKALTQGRRDRVVLATKGHFPTSDDPNDRGNSRRHLVNAVEGSLRRLRTDRIDLYQIHRPDSSTPQEETLRALDDLVTQGKVLYIGSSTFPAWILMEALGISERRGWVRFATEQPPYNLLDRRIENELVPLALRHGLGLLTWSPLGMGMLAGRYERAGTPPQGSRVDRLGGIYRERVTDPAIAAARAFAEVARKAGMDPASMAMAWVRTRPGVTAPIVGPRTEAHLDLALASVGIQIDAQVSAQLDEIVPPGSSVANFLNNAGAV